MLQAMHVFNANAHYTHHEPARGCGDTRGRAWCEYLEARYVPFRLRYVTLKLSLTRDSRSLA